MSIDDLSNIALRLAYRSARLGLDAAQAGLDLAKVVVDMFDPDPSSAPRHHDDPVSRMFESIEAIANVIGPERPLGQALRPGGVVDRLFARGGTLDRLSDSEGLKGIIQDVVGVDIERLDSNVQDLRLIAEELNAAAAPLGRIASRVPKFLRRPLPYEKDRHYSQLQDDGHGLVNTAWYETGPEAGVNGHSLLNGDV